VEENKAPIDKIDKYLMAHDRCMWCAELSSDAFAKNAWLKLAESYRLLIVIDDLERRGALIPPV